MVVRRALRLAFSLLTRKIDTRTQAQTDENDVMKDKALRFLDAVDSLERCDSDLACF